ncbi:MAG: PEP/pyruvate-binding domain-containing protein [Chloroflexota bacterium]
MSRISYETSKILNLYLLIAQYPMLAPRIREQMRGELFHRGIITVERFEEEARERALQSQEREGMTDPTTQESPECWEQRLGLVREHLTDFYFAYNLPREMLIRIIDDVVAQPGRSSNVPENIGLMFNPELAPLEMVLKQAEKYEALPPDQREAANHHLQELIVVLLKSLISDQLAFVRIAKRWFTAADFRYILDHRIGTGKIGGKSAGLLLAYKILQNTAPPDVFERVVLPRSYFVGADVFYDFLALNQVELLDQKYKSAEQIRAEYPGIQEAYSQARFPEEIADQLREILVDLGNTPLIVRSSSLLEDNFGTSFAGKYVSYFCPNQGTLKENLRDLTLAIRRVYASVYGPDALMYRRRMGLIDYDERMAILLQEVQGQRYHQNYFPTVAGVAYSYSPITWNPRLRREDGFVRLVMGLGTRAVDRVANDYPRMIYLSHPQLRPEVTRKAIRYYSQHFIDMLDLAQNEFVTRPVEEVLGSDFHSLRWVASIDDGDTIRPPLTLGSRLSPDQLVLTFDYLLQRSDFVPTMKIVLAHLAEQYQLPVDVEFAASLSPSTGVSRPRLDLHLLQCRPQNRGIARDTAIRPVPTDIPEGNQIFLCSKMVPQGEVSQIEYIVYVDPASYHALSTPRDYTDVARLIGQINKSLEEKVFILIGPGRWGSSDYMQGVPVTYADIFNARALIELALQQRGYNSEPSYGTHFFQDLVETQIYPLAISPDDPHDFLNWDFLNQANDCLPALNMRGSSPASCCIKVIHIPSERPGSHFDLVMDGQRGLGYLYWPGS